MALATFSFLIGLKPGLVLLFLINPFAEANGKW